MRRARIKAVATVPVRRKAVQDSTQAAPPVQTDVKEFEKLPDKIDQCNNESVAIDTQEKSIVNVLTLQSPQQLPSSPLKNKVAKLENAPKSPQKGPCISHIKEEVQESENIPKSSPKTSISPLKEKELENLSQSKQEEPTSLVKEKRFSEINVQDNNNLQPSQKSDVSPKPTVASVEVKIHQSRSHFTRPMPRLDGSGRIRRNSIQGSGASASESEDDSRRSSSVVPNRVRNDSVSSTFSLKDTGNVSNISKLNLGQKRRMVVSESARKLAESRREFLLKHEHKPPDKSKLTMYDLIYYNPVTNPMTPKPPNKQAARKNSICSIHDSKEEKIVDKPAEMLVPQVKVGPNEQLIIDEQSLVIDQYKAQENIDRSDILIDDETSGFYKRRSKSKDWSKWETLKFYKALNTYGTDFLLMKSIFPHRTRQELKLKYKKEEKINHNLVEKALVYQQFDTETLEKDLAKVDESERLETESNKKVKKKDKEKDKKRKRIRCQKLVKELNCEDDQNSDENKNSGEEQTSDEEKIEKPIPKRRRATRKRKMMVFDTNSDGSLNNDTDSNPELYEIQTTRSGRTSRKTKKLQKIKRTTISKNKEETKRAPKMNDKKNNNEKNIEEGNPNCNGDKNEDIIIIEEQTIAKNIDNNDSLGTSTTETKISTIPGEFTDVPNIKNLEPGSWVVLTKDNANEPGKKIVQHYIVSPDYDGNNPSRKDNFIPITLPPDVMNTVINCIENIEPGNIS
ncbi:transcription factor TFIIIB component B'' homolog [Phymastichus coffea]|uniref:transcription factor TFIIIB component B'' homolog n=1 Tax=Phymastichus coffea TaxID=108790 RepID=UPI00273AFBD5|nr:transcription factor TFIIIB component B'' homolog [Phymastichus coffea]